MLMARPATSPPYPFAQPESVSCGWFWRAVSLAEPGAPVVVGCAGAWALSWAAAAHGSERSAFRVTTSGNCNSDLTNVMDGLDGQVNGRMAVLAVPFAVASQSGRHHAVRPAEGLVAGVPVLGPLSLSFDVKFLPCSEVASCLSRRSDLRPHERRWVPRDLVLALQHLFHHDSESPR